MDPARLKAVSQRGGQESQRRGTGYRWRSSTEAARAAAKSGRRTAGAAHQEQGRKSRVKKPSIH